MTNKPIYEIISSPFAILTVFIHEYLACKGTFFFLTAQTSVLITKSLCVCKKFRRRNFLMFFFISLQLVRDPC